MLLSNPRYCLNCTVLFCITVLYCTVLCCTVLCCTLLYFRVTQHLDAPSEGGSARDWTRRVTYSFTYTCTCTCTCRMYTRALVCT